MHGLIRVQTPILLMLALAMVAAAFVDGRGGAQAAESTPEPGALDGRLGGTRASFTEEYGTPLSEDTVNGSRYDVAEFGLVLVSFRQLEREISADDVAAVVVLRSPRPETVPATAEDEADWSLDEAREVAAAFLPADAELGEVGEAEDEELAEGRLAVPCESEALAATTPEARSGGDAGACTVTLLAPTDESVSFITLALGDTGVSFEADPCAGVAEWGVAVGKRLTRANEALETVGDLAEDDPETAGRLEEIAATFGALATEQGSVEVPPAAVAANSGLAEAFGAYATAMATAAKGLADGDTGALESASVAVEDARGLYQDANDLVVAAIEGCELTE